MESALQHLCLYRRSSAMIPFGIKIPDSLLFKIYFAQKTKIAVASGPCCKAPGNLGDPWGLRRWCRGGKEVCRPRSSSRTTGKERKGKPYEKMLLEGVLTKLEGEMAEQCHPRWRIRNLHPSHCISASRIQAQEWGVMSRGAACTEDREMWGSMKPLSETSHNWTGSALGLVATPIMEPPAQLLACPDRRWREPGNGTTYRLQSVRWSQVSFGAADIEGW